MHLRRIAGHVLILIYAVFTLSAFSLTMLRLELPFGVPITRFLYGAMAPYQSHDILNGEILAEALIANEWRVIDLAQYYPVIPGERSIREHFTIHRLRRHEPERQQTLIASFARTLFEHEAIRDPAIERIRLSWQSWPVSPGGFRFLKQPAFTHTTFLTEYPVQP